MGGINGLLLILSILYEIPERANELAYRLQGNKTSTELRGVSWQAPGQSRRKLSLSGGLQNTPLELFYSGLVVSDRGPYSN